MQHLTFYLRHAWNNMRRNGQRTAFVLFCIAAGVSAVVSLRSLGFMIGDAILENLQADLRGDLVISPVSEFAAGAREIDFDADLVNDGGQFGGATFTQEGLDQILAWAEARGYTAAPARRDDPPLLARRAVDPQSQETMTLLFVDPATYPFYRVLEMAEPPGAPLSQLLEAPQDIVITEALAATLGVGVGDDIRLTGAREPFTVRGLVADTTEASLTDPSTLLIPFGYVSFEVGRTVYGRQADTIYIKLPEGVDVETAEQTASEAFPSLRARTTDDLEAVNEEVSRQLTRLITTTGLVSLLIGGIGIINTMLVVVRRRALEIGVLKTVGLYGRQITLMFMIEALLLGLIGSGLGSLLGVGLTRLLQSVGERVASRALTFTVYPEAILTGVIVGTLITLVFGFLPTLAAGRVRPNIVLNPTDQNPIPQQARWQSALVILGLTGIVGLIVGRIIDNTLNGLALTGGVFVLVGLAALIMWLVVLVLTALPNFGRVRFMLAQRAMSTHRGRTASTLLALVVGMFSLSFLLLFTQSIIDFLNVSLDDQLGGNVLAIGQTYPTVEAIRETAEGLPGVRNIEFESLYQVEIVAIDGDRDMARLTAAARDVALAELSADEDEPLTDERLERRRVGLNFEINFFTEQLFVQPAGGDLTYTVDAGRDVSDAPGELVLQQNDASEWLGLTPGHTLTLRFDEGDEITVEIVGAIEPLNVTDLIQVQASGANIPAQTVVSPGTIPDAVNPIAAPIIIDVADENLDAAIEAISAVPGAIVFEARLIQSFITRILEQLTALPLVVAILALFASSVIIANTVSLATLERRREIGIMKALGLRSNQVLSLLLLENGLLGLLGGLLGVSVGAGVSLVTVLSDTSGMVAFPFATLGWLILLAVGIAVGATLITAIGAAREKPLIVLRYE